MDEQLVLTAHTLKLNPNMQRSEMAGEVFVVKNVPARRYLTVSIEQWNLLRNFVNPATAPDVLRAVILNRTCLPFREYYELVLKAQRAGILQTDRQTEPEVRARAWHVSLGPVLPLVLTWVAIVAALFFLFTEPVVLDVDKAFRGVPPLQIAQNLAIGWALLAVGLSAGHALAACVLRGGGGEVYTPRFLWLRPVPYFSVNLDDACMTNRVSQAGVWSARLFFVAGSAAALWKLYPEWGILHVLALLIMLHPFDGGAIPRILSAVCRGNVLDTQQNLLFSLNRLWAVRFKIGLSRVSFLYVAARLFWGVGWIVLVLCVGLLIAGRNPGDFLTDRQLWKPVPVIFGSMLGAVLIVYFGAPISRFTWTWITARYHHIRTIWQRWRVKPTAALTDEQSSRLVNESILFRRLAPADRAELLKVATPRMFKSWTMLCKFTDKTPDVGIIISGKALFYRRTKAGRAEKAFTLVEGDVFGAHALLDPERQHAQVRSLTPVLALMIPHAEFEKRVVARLGVSLSNDLIQKVPFLRSLSFCSNWHPQAIARFAQLASVVSFNAEELVVAERQDSQQFYVVYEGRVVVKRNNKVKARLKPGAFFGEVSLLQNSAAVSDVVARDATRCFTIAKSDFLRFVTHNPLVGLQLEKISSDRLGRAIFPLATQSFDIR